MLNAPASGQRWACIYSDPLVFPCDVNVTTIQIYQIHQVVLGLILVELEFGSDGF